MRFQWSLILSLVFALIVAIFAVFNTEAVTVDFLFKTTSVPLILIILWSALGGALSVGLYGIFRQYRLQREIKRLKEELTVYQNKAEEKMGLSPSKTPSDASHDNAEAQTPESTDPSKPNAEASKAQES